MVDASSIAPPRKKHHFRRRKEPSKRPSRGLVSTSSETSANDLVDIDRVRRARADYYATPSENRPEVAGTSMAPEQHQRRRRPRVTESSRLGSITEDQETRAKSHGEHRHRHRRPKIEDGYSTVYVYRSANKDKEQRSTVSLRSPRVTVGERRASFIPDPLRILRTLKPDRHDRTLEPKESRSRPRSGIVRRHTYPAVDKIAEVPRARSVKRVDSDSVTVTSSHRPRLVIGVSMREPSVRSASRPSVARSQTSTRKVRRVPAQQPVLPLVREESETVVTSTKKVDTPIKIFGVTFGGSKAAVPEAQVECLACMSDDIPISKAAKLACGHRMCHPCLRRIFTMSVSDPAHMPPTCCTSDHIPLKHVEKLFDLKFKMKWNKKYQEYTTKNRIYCPAKGCGEWIKPAQIHTDTSGGANTGRKYGRCALCKTKVCTTCNSRWHASAECPKDEATTRFAEIAQREGWQRCYNCSAMVELKEGCNHMTCRCRAEFCMICGVPWKGCDCPWFTYAAVEQDRLLHADDAQARREGHRAEIRARHAELWDVQNRADEELARTLQRLHVQEHDEDLAAAFAPTTPAQNEQNRQRVAANVAHANTRAGRPVPRNIIPGQHPPAHHRANIPQHLSASMHGGLMRAMMAAVAERDGTINEPAYDPPNPLGPGFVTERHVERMADAQVMVQEFLTTRAAQRVVRRADRQARRAAMAGLTQDNTTEGRVAEWRQHVEDDGGLPVV
ncbi:hypothetical protein MMC13_005888 [Lambiella insularis]|nr:hypothetical protein [Lambiella insularis]